MLEERGKERVLYKAVTNSDCIVVLQRSVSNSAVLLGLSLAVIRFYSERRIDNLFLCIICTSLVIFPYVIFFLFIGRQDG